MDPDRLRKLALELTSETSAPEGHLRIAVSGESMKPTLRNGDGILVQPGAQGGIAVGDVITFLTDSGPVTHRVVQTDGERLITKGDNSRRFDPPVERSRVVGVVIAGLRGDVRRELQRGRRAARIARFSRLEGRFSNRFRPGFQRTRWFRLANLPLRLLVTVSAYSGLSR